MSESTCTPTKTPKGPGSHPFEMAICGYTGSGKTTLIGKLIGSFKGNYSVGFHKHDVHAFDMDREGKDTWKASQSGASQILIDGDSRHAYIGEKGMDVFSLSAVKEQCDISLVEGYKDSELPKLLLLDEEGQLTQNFLAGRFSNVLGLIYPDKKSLPSQTDIPSFHRDDVSGIASFILSHFEEKLKQIPLYGLVLNGGLSSRMGEDKGQMDYHGKAQVRYAKELLEPFCEKVFVSTRPGKTAEGFSEAQTIYDSYLNTGPLGGILSAQKQFPKAAFLVLACDLPLVSHKSLEQIVKQRNPFKLASCFSNPENNLPEPLIAIYEPKFFKRAHLFIAQGFGCPRKVLINSNSHVVEPKYPQELANANTKEDYHQLKSRLKEG